MLGQGAQVLRDGLKLLRGFVLVNRRHRAFLGGESRRLGRKVARAIRFPCDVFILGRQPDLFLNRFNFRSLRRRKKLRCGFGQGSMERCTQAKGLALRAGSSYQQ